ncbi:MAG: SDR family oxidoreductase [Deltaproteobacteria bacterium]|nr:SDR family oxidoreductase [Deltaproteobacteria bacterium]
MILVTGATGKLGRHVVAGLLEKVPASELAIAVRSPDKAADLAARGVTVRQADYLKPATMEAALAGADKVLLISSSELGDRATQHKAVVDAARKHKVGLLAYTSILHADTSRIGLAADHRTTEAYIRAADVPFVFLRNGWYLENYSEHLAPVLQYGAVLGSAGQGRVAAAARADYAAAAVSVLTGTGHAGKSYELAGDVAFTLAELAAEVARQAGKPVVYNDMPVEAYRGALQGAGLPAAYAELLADSDLGIARGELDDRSGDLHRLINRPTTPLADAIAAALKQG